VRIVFMGTPEFAVPSLKKLMENEEILGVVTQPDRPRGRGQKVRPSPVKSAVQGTDIPVYQPEKVSDPDFISEIKKLSPQVLVVVAYGQIIPSELFNYPKYEAVNLHASLLPEYRGASPIHWAVINGEQKTGLTTMFISEEMDAGDIIYQKEIPIKPTDTVGSLHDKMAEEGAELLMKTMCSLETGDNPRIEQDHSKATLAPRIKKEDALIDWNLPAEKIKNLVRGTNPWPGAYTFYRGKRLKILTVEISEKLKLNSDKPESEPGTVVYTDDKEGIIVKTGCGLIALKEVKPAGKRKMKAVDFLHGYHIAEGTKFSRSEV